MKSICVFAASNPGYSPHYIKAAEKLGTDLAERGITLVYGGASVGLMGAVADAAMWAGGDVIGIIPEHLMNKELAHPSLTQLEVVESMHTRKARMAELSDAFIALPGSIGTLEELFEVFTWGQLGIHRKPFGLLEVDNYWQHLITFLDHVVVEGFLSLEHRHMLMEGENAEDLLDQFAAWTPPPFPEWLDIDIQDT